jgi:hypothetical protein
VIEGHTYLAPRINVFSNIMSQDVTLSCRDPGFPRVGKQTEPLRRNADGLRDLPKTADIADLPTTRQDLGDIRAINAQPVRELRLRQALLLHERRQDAANVRTAPKPGLFSCPTTAAPPAPAVERRPHHSPPLPATAMPCSWPAARQTTQSHDSIRLTPSHQLRVSAVALTL